MGSIFVCDTPSGEHSGRVFESMSQVDVSLTDRPARRLTRLKVAQGPMWQLE